MKITKTDVYESKENVFNSLSDIHRLKQLIVPNNFYDLVSFEDFDVIVQQNSLANGINGFIKLVNSTFLLPKIYFQIMFNSLNAPIPKTTICLTISDEPIELTLQYKEQTIQIKQSQSKNFNRIAMVAAIALVAMMIPSGIAINDHIQGSNITISDTEGLLYLSQQSNINNNPQDAIYYGDKVLLDEKINIDAAKQIREAYSSLEKYDVLLPQKSSTNPCLN